MVLFNDKKTRGNWHFDSDKYGYNYDDAPYPEIINDLRKLFTELITTKMLFPRRIEGIDRQLNYGSIDELLEIIIESELLNNTFQFNIMGDTTIYTNNGEESYSEIFSVDCFRTFQQSFIISNYSDVWLPMAFDSSSYNFEWNLEYYNTNYKRLPSLLKNLSDVFSWENENLLIKNYQERGCIQVGNDLFLSEEVIRREYKDNPNPSFDLAAYLQKIKDIEHKLNNI